MSLTTSDSVSKIAAALVKVSAEIENPTKNATNPHFRNHYADLAEIVNTSREVLAKHGLTVVQCPGMEDNFVTVDSLLLHESGEWIRGVAASPIPKADPQGVGSATTYLRRYSLAALLGLAQEDDDGETASQTRNPSTGERHPSVRDLAGEAPRGHVPAQQRANGNGGHLLDGLVPVGKHKGKRWRDLLEREPQYVDWAIKNMERLDFELKDALFTALQAKREPVAAAPAKAPVPLSQPDDDLPF